MLPLGHRRWFLAASLSLVSMACSHKTASPPAPTPAPAAAAPAAKPAVPSLASQGIPDGTANVVPAAAAQEEDDAERTRWKDCLVYLDGDPIAVLTVGELPASVPVKWQTVGADVGEPMQVRRYLLNDYLAGLGIDVRTVKQVHLYGGRERVSIVAGPELYKFRDQVRFSFTQGEKGKPRMHYPNQGGFHTNDSIDMIAAIAIYRDKKPPELQPDGQFLTFDGQTKIDGIPYVTKEYRGGTRVYVDGRLVTSIKRNTLSQTLVLPGPATNAPRYPLMAVLDFLGVNTKSVRSLELIANEKPAGSMGGKDFSKLTKDLVFAAPPGNHGRIVLHLPDSSSEDPPVQVIALYTRDHKSSRIIR